MLIILHNECGELFAVNTLDVRMIKNISLNGQRYNIMTMNTGEEIKIIESAEQVVEIAKNEGEG